jgi:hypothetical protein
MKLLISENRSWFVDDGTLVALALVALAVVLAVAVMYSRITRFKS